MQTFSLEVLYLNAERLYASGKKKSLLAQMMMIFFFNMKDAGFIWAAKLVTLKTDATI